MSTATAYNLTSEIVSTAYFTLHTAAHQTSGEQYLIKKFIKQDAEKIATLRNGVKLAAELQLDAILDPVELFEESGNVTIVYRYFNACTLRHLVQQKKKFAPGVFVQAAVKLTQLLLVFHTRGWIIKNICPENILINEADFTCKLADLRRASRVYKKESSDIYEKASANELHYISPEQTGRVNNITDNRSDLYALGTIFYEMLAGTAPFGFTSPAEIIHAHLALPVKPLQQVPQVLNDIVCKLLAKNPEERYQSAEGLLHDLQNAENFFEHPRLFRPGLKDKIRKIQPTTKLIGRQAELEVLNNAYSAVKTAKKQAVYIKGYSGVGKTRIVQEFYRNKLADNVVMVSSKFDTQQRNTPYSAFIIAIKELVKKILKEEDEQLIYWKQRIQNHLRENAAIIIEAVPELEVLVGPQPQVNSLPPEEAQKRFQQTFINFISAFTTQQHLLILFLDDLQWADIASVRLTELILLDDTVKNFLFIGAYRDNEVDATHPLAISIRKQESWINLHEAEVLPLQTEQTATLIAETLHSRIINSQAFTGAVFKKTGGNTFFTIQLLTALFEEGILKRNEEGDWEWDEKMLQESNVSDNVVDFLEKKITALEPQLQQLLLTASCLGDVFDLKTLVLLHQKKMNVVANKLSVIINSGYLIALDDYLDGYFKTTADAANDEMRFLNIPRFRFAHDRIRQTALSMLPEEKKAQLNLQAARIKLSNLPPEEIEQEIFYIANHFNAGKNLISSNDELQQLAQYNLQAGIKAKNASAFDAAIRYFNTAKPHLSLSNNYAELYQLQLQLAECLYLTGNYSEAENNLDDLYSICKTKIDRLNTLFVKVYLYNIQDKKLEAVDAGKKGYGLYNIYMPRNKMLVMLLLLKEIFVTNIKVPEKKIGTLLQRPLLKDPEQIRFQEFLLAMAPTLYQYDQNVFAWNFMRMMSASLRFGNNGISSFSYIGYGMLVSQLFGKYRMGKKLADVAIQLNNQLGYTALKWKVRLSYYNFVHHWTEPVRPELDNILEVENGAYANGDPIFAGYAIFIFHQKKFALGFQLKELQTSFENYLRVVEQRHDVETHHFLESYYYAIRCLRGLETATAVMGAAFDAPVRLRQYTDASSFTVVADTFIAYMSTLFLFGHTGEAYRRYTEAVKYMDFIQQRYEFAEFNFYSVLICTAAYEQKISIKPSPAAQIKKHLKKLKVWKEHCAANFEPQYLLATAEYEKISGSGQRVAALYEQAIESAARYQFINYKAIACEQAGRYQFNNGNKMIAKTYLDNARKAYQQWGATAKVLQLESEFNELLGNTILEKGKLQENNSSLTAGFDVNTLLQATQAVKSEKDIDKLVEQLMKTIIQYSGADTGYLLVKSKADLVVKAKYSNAAGVQAVTEYADNEMMPMSIIKYVIRLKEPHILNNPAAIAEYSNTRYFEKNKPRALICYPVLKQGEIFGVLYLENYATEAVFDEQKINMLSLIAAQAAVALDNAYLYENMESRIMERTEAIEAEKGIVDEMLENILPKAAIEELKLTGRTTAQKLDDVTVLLADIKGFTKISEKLTPEELIAKIDFYFRSFDDIMVKYGLEKIKTIGDAYMAAGGLAGDAANGAVNMVKAAFEMQQCIMDENKDVAEDEKLEMRIGIHTGTVIAGVVGVKKYQYDMWGDTVNIAARMEQESEPGRINVSKQTVALTNGTVAYTYRGKIDAKNKGPMDMFFADEMVQSTVDP